MIKVSILYPNSGASRFDGEYYVATHMPMAIALLSQHPGYRGVCVERGIVGVVPGSAPAFVALCHFTFASVADFVAAFTPHAQQVEADIERYTDVRPVIQFSEVVISG